MGFCHLPQLLSLTFAALGLNGNEIPEQLPEELVPASARDLNESVDFLKDILKNETRTRSPGNFDDPVSKLPTRSFHSDTARGAGGRQDATVYKHDDKYTPPGGVYQPRSRHIDRDTVRTRSDDPTDDLSVMKRQLENTAKMLDRSNEENAARTREDDELEREMSDLRYRIKRLQGDLDYVSRGPRSYAKDEEKRELERELLHLMHEKLPDLEKRISENQARKDKEKREQVRDRDRRNERFGRFSDRDDEYSRRYDDDDRYRSSYGRDRSREGDRPRDDYDRRDYDRRDRDRSDYRDRDYRQPPPQDTRTPPPPPPSNLPSNSISKLPPAPPPPSSTPSNMAKMTKEERQAYIKAEAQRQIQERMKALGITTSASVPTIDSNVADRLAQEKREAEEKAKAAERAEEERARIRQERLASEKAIKEGKILEPPSPASAPTPTVSSPAKPPAPPPPKTRARPPPPPTKPSRPAAPPAPTPPGPVISEPPPPPRPDPEEERIKRLEGESRKRREAMQARLRALEEEEEAARKAEADIETRRQALSSRTPIESPSTPVPPPPPPQPIQPTIQAPPAPAPTTPDPPKDVPTDKPSFNPFSRIKKEEPTASVAPSLSVTTGTGSMNPFFRSQTAPPPVAPAPSSNSSPVSKQHYNTANDDTDEEWGEVVEKDEDDSSEDEFTSSRAKRTNLAEKFFGNIIPPARPQSAGPGTIESPRTPVHASTIPDVGLPPPPAPAPPSLFPNDNIPPPPPPGPPPPVQTLAPLPQPTENRSALLNAIQGGTKLKKAITNDRSGSGISGRVVGDAAPPAHINTALNPPSPTLAPGSEHFSQETFNPPSMSSEDTKGSNRLSVDWYAGLAADHSASRAPTLSSMREEEEEVAPPIVTPQPVFNVQAADEPEQGFADIMDDVDRSTGGFPSIAWMKKIYTS